MQREHKNIHKINPTINKKNTLQTTARGEETFTSSKAIELCDK